MLVTKQMTACPPMNRKIGAISVLFAALLLLATNRRGTAPMVLHQGRDVAGQNTGSEGETWFSTEAGPAGAGQTQRQHLDAQPAQAAAAGTATAQGQIARLPAMQQPHPAADKWWHAMHTNFTGAVKAADGGRGFDLIFYGDSLVEMWRGTRADRPYSPRAQHPGIFHDHFQVAWRAAAFGMSGDTVARLHWRLLHGEVPRRHLPRLLVVLVGTNDLSHAKAEWEEAADAERTGTAEDAIAEAAPAVAQQIGLVLGLLRRRLPRSQILLLALLPRDEADAPHPREWPNVYTKGLTIVNRRLQRYANQHAEEVTFLDCGAIFFDRPDRLSAKWLPDALHPSAAGAALFAECVASALKRLDRQPR